jgi:hypothetical protein
MIGKLYEDIRFYFQNYYFEIVIIACIIFLVLYGIYSKLWGIKGTWSKSVKGGTYEDQEIDDIESGKGSEIRKRRRGGSGGESKGEVECRRVMQKIFDKPFYKSRPRFLNNPVTFGTNNLELDCYNEELKIAVEYDGAQHFKFIPYFHKTQEAFMNQRYRDYMKDQMCKENGIILIRVPYTVKIPQIEGYIIDKLKQL